jgi:dihydroceramide fatty acyl 2-hydroxylase
MSLINTIYELDPEKYHNYIHKPSLEVESRPLFDNSFLEANSHTPWWIIPIVWIPQIVTEYVAADSISILSMIFGLCLWSPFEYVLHRWVFHAHTKSRIMNVFHFMFHGIHHLMPLDKTRLVFPPFPGYLFMYLPLRFILSFIFTPIHSIMIGFIIGYITYDLTHYSLHHTKPQGGIFGYLKRAHMIHHFEANGHKNNFGVSALGKIMDFILNTNE